MLLQSTWHVRSNRAVFFFATTILTKTKLNKPSQDTANMMCESTCLKRQLSVLVELSAGVAEL
jgi:hypothetical protein